MVWSRSSWMNGTGEWPWFIHTIPTLYNYLSIHPCIIIHSFIRSFIHSFIHSINCWMVLFIYLFIWPFSSFHNLLSLIFFMSSVGLFDFFDFFLYIFLLPLQYLVCLLLLSCEHSMCCVFMLHKPLINHQIKKTK